ncbi:hypothetical protein ACH5RR_031972 [Cinchona calisaya]|uniref:Uncharacterized protein n=1 Tax=Cinchona calisaya TaxID=153742 RepID=A0ABD2YL06_9GENT
MIGEGLYAIFHIPEPFARSEAAEGGEGPPHCSPFVGLKHHLLDLKLLKLVEEHSTSQLELDLDLDLLMDLKLLKLVEEASELELDLKLLKLLKLMDLQFPNQWHLRRLRGLPNVISANRLDIIRRLVQIHKHKHGEN